MVRGIAENVAENTRPESGEMTASAIWFFEAAGMQVACMAHRLWHAA